MSKPTVEEIRKEVRRRERYAREQRNAEAAAALNALGVWIHRRIAADTQESAG